MVLPKPSSDWLRDNEKLAEALVGGNTRALAQAITLIESTRSDHRDAAFGEAYGVLIKELRLLARAIFVVDKDGTLQYSQLVKEVTEEPDYDAALDAVKKLF